MGKERRGKGNKPHRLVYFTLPTVVLCLMFPVYAPEASDNASLPARETKQKSATIGAWKETLSALLSKFHQANNTQEAVRSLNEAGRLQLVWSSTKDAFATFQQSYDLLHQNVDSVTRVDTLN